MSQEHTQAAATQDDDQRRALEEAEKNAKKDQPESYKDEETADKRVEIGPDMTDAPIRGIDPVSDR